MNDFDDFDPDANILAENLDIKTRLRMHLAMLSGGEVVSEEQQRVTIKAELRAKVDAMLQQELDEVVQEEFEASVREELGYGGWQ